MTRKVRRYSHRENEKARLRTFLVWTNRRATVYAESNGLMVAYDNAMIKAQTLYYTTGYSTDTEKAWNEKREALIKELQKHIKVD